MRAKRAYKPLSPEKQARKNAALLEKRRAAGVKPKKKNVLTADQMREEHRKYMAVYRGINKERIKARRLERREELTEAGRKYYAENKESVKESCRKWKAKNRDKVNVWTNNRRAKLRAVGGKLSTNIVKRLVELQRGKCVCCGELLGDRFHMDHIMPIALGGTNTDDNIQLLRDVCNMSKQAKHPIDYMQRRGFLL